MKKYSFRICLETHKTVKLKIEQKVVKLYLLLSRYSAAQLNSYIFFYFRTFSAS